MGPTPEMRTMATNATETQPSFYYMLIARSCFQRSRVVADAARAQALSDAGRDYLAKARADTACHRAPRQAAA